MHIRKKPPDQNNETIRIDLRHNRFALILPADYELVTRYSWQAKRSKSGWYALAKFTRHGKTHYIRMHRLIMNTPQGLECHHLNGNRLDNRRWNLENHTPRTHRQITSCRKKTGDTHKPVVTTP